GRWSSTWTRQDAARQRSPSCTYRSRGPGTEGRWPPESARRDLVVRTNTVWMTVNLLLAALPFILALVLFVPGRPRTVAWWLGLGTFVVFLPNAPYVLTDVIHLSGQIRRTGSTLHAGLLVVEYATFMAVGLALYGGCLFLL